MSILIQPIDVGQVFEAKRLILSVARTIFEWEAPLDDIVRRYDESGELQDVDDPQSHYFQRDGVSLVALDGGQIIGTGAIRRLGDDSAELKRLWLAEAYHGQGVGYRLYQALLLTAHARGYRRIHLQTDARQGRARRFYTRRGFREVRCLSDDPHDICMELILEAT